MNNVVLVGRLTRDVELKKTSNDIAVASFTVAINRPFTNESGEREADFINCVVWRKQADNLAKYCKKGDQIGVIGRIQTRSYETDDGIRYVTEVLAESITFLETKKDDSARDQKQHRSPNDDTFHETSKKLNVEEEDLPF